ncbi:hypothetical protein D3C85_863280 [compost metagenome]
MSVKSTGETFEFTHVGVGAEPFKVYQNPFFVSKFLATILKVPFASPLHLTPFRLVTSAVNPCPLLTLRLKVLSSKHDFGN